MAAGTNPWIDAELRLEPDPYSSFETWYAAAEAVVAQPHAMALATVDGEGRPSLRMVLFRQVADGAFRFYTNCGSRKAAELAANPAAALLFHWHPLGRQVRLEGRVSPLADEDSDAYFATRDRESQLGAWASRQSAPLASREALQAEMARMRERFADRPVPRPEHWGGYGLVPERFEFWQNRPNRLHDRFRYERESGGWRVERLSP
ncbi:MAG TPA: pyridoxamine 5'-phosphate oxidase [bacterium]|nr:pyridoxamine 5'-phosphate oxidase [bacterium]